MICLSKFSVVQLKLQQNRIYKVVRRSNKIMLEPCNNVLTYFKLRTLNSVKNINKVFSLDKDKLSVIQNIIIKIFSGILIILVILNS